LLADGIGCCIRMVVRSAAPSSLRMIIRSIVEAARGLDNTELTPYGVQRLVSFLASTMMGAGIIDRCKPC
jgi:hypothetical protein